MRLLFSVSGGVLAVLTLSTSVAIVIADIVIAAMVVGRKHGESNDARRIADTNKPNTARPTTAIDSAITATGRPPLLSA
jgi:hypothetical protein